MTDCRFNIYAKKSPFLPLVRVGRSEENEGNTFSHVCKGWARCAASLRSGSRPTPEWKPGVFGRGGDWPELDSGSTQGLIVVPVFQVVSGKRRKPKGK